MKTSFINQKTERRMGAYWVEGIPYVSVTNILSVIDKPALRYWFGKQVYLAMIKDPTLSQEAALAAPNQISDTAKSRGSTVHSIVESFKHTGNFITDVAEPFTGYATAFENFIKDVDVEILGHEKTVYSQLYGYAGTLDLLVRMKHSNKVFIIDIKTGREIYPEAFMQLSAYRQALKEEGTVVDSIGVLLLSDKGKYKFAEGDDCLESFLCAKKLWEWTHWEDFQKIFPQPKASVIVLKEN